MHEDDRYSQVISGRRRGVSAMVGRGFLRVASLPYGVVTRVRNWYYDSLALPTWLDVPVISVGNLTVGGTGKTPMTLWLCRRMLERGLKPAVLSRGYKASEEGLADELLLISRQCPQAVAIAHPDRAAAGELAVTEYKAKVAILDDGFQHRRLGRDLDIVLIDATRPLGYGYILPRGLLRESPAGLRRASAIVITRADQCERTALEGLIGTLSRYNAEAPVLQATHRSVGFTDLAGQPTEPPVASFGCFAGIANPQAFLRSLEAMQLKPSAVQWWPDHHLYTDDDASWLVEWARSRGLRSLVTTEKDAVKLDALNLDWPLPLVALSIEMDLLAGGEGILAELIDDMLREASDDHNGALP